MRGWHKVVTLVAFSPFFCHRSVAHPNGNIRDGVRGVKRCNGYPVGSNSLCSRHTHVINQRTSFGNEAEPTLRTCSESIDLPPLATSRAIPFYVTSTHDPFISIFPSFFPSVQLPLCCGGGQRTAAFFSSLSRSTDHGPTANRIQWKAGS